MNQNVHIKIAILTSLKGMPEGYPQTDDSLIAQVSLSVVPRPTRLAIEDMLTELESMSYIVGVRNELTGARKWMITDAGKCALAQI